MTRARKDERPPRGRGAAPEFHADQGIARLLDRLMLVPTRYRQVPPPSRRADLVPGAHVSVAGAVLAARRARQRRGGSFLDLSLDVDGPLRICFYNRGWLKDRVTK